MALCFMGSGNNSKASIHHIIAIYIKHYKSFIQYLPKHHNPHDRIHTADAFDFLSKSMHLQQFFYKLTIRNGYVL